LRNRGEKRTWASITVEFQCRWWDNADIGNHRHHHTACGGLTFIDAQDTDNVGLLDTQADGRRDELVVNNLRLVRFAVRLFGRDGLDNDDLMQDGAVALLKGAGQFDSRRGTWARFVVWRVRGAVTRAARKEAKHQRRREDNHRRRMRRDGGDGDATDLLDTIPDARGVMAGESLARREDADQVRRLLDTIGQRAATVLRLAYGIGAEPLSRAEIAGRLGVSEERVRQIENQGLERLRTMMDDG